MDELRVDLGDRSYSILVGAGLLDRVELVQPYIGSTVAVVTSQPIARHYLARTRAMLIAAGSRVVEIVLPDGEQAKTWETLTVLFDGLLANKCDRATTLVALGGGVVGDVTGFAAATYQRGVPFIQVPTTLLAQVDSSVGGKTAINHPLGKNMIGAFYQPALVLADIDTLATLPDREFRSGLAEVVKYGFVSDPVFLAWLEEHLEALLRRESGPLIHAIRRSCEIKAGIVMQDERESGNRAWLNFGHTFGHAIESGLGYGQWLHGEAVAAGMVVAADLSSRLGHLSAAEAARVRKLIERAGLPVALPDLGVERFLELMRLDKKADKGDIRYVLLKRLGEAFVAPVADAVVTLALQSNVRITA